jgi:hypothetical protein
MWFPLREFFQCPTTTSLIKATMTVVLAFPPGYFNSSSDSMLVGNDIYFVDKPTAKNLVQLLERYPLPADILDVSRDREVRLESLAKYVRGLLPATSVKPQSPEPVLALELLGDQDGVKYPKLCSKDSKIFVQYAAALGFVTRMVQLKNHVAAGVFNENNGQWEMYDPYFGCAPRYRGEVISSIVASDLLAAGMDFDFCGPKDVFRSVTIIPRTDFAKGKLPRWHFFNYDNLAYWRPMRR